MVVGRPWTSRVREGTACETEAAGAAAEVVKLTPASATLEGAASTSRARLVARGGGLGSLGLLFGRGLKVPSSLSMT